MIDEQSVFPILSFELKVEQEEHQSKNTVQLFFLSKFFQRNDCFESVLITESKIAFKYRCHFVFLISIVLFFSSLVFECWCWHSVYITRVVINVFFTLFTFIMGMQLLLMSFCKRNFILLFYFDALQNKNRNWTLKNVNFLVIAGY